MKGVARGAVLAVQTKDLIGGRERCSLRVGIRSRTRRSDPIKSRPDTLQPDERSGTDARLPSEKRGAVQRDLRRDAQCR